MKVVIHLSSWRIASTNVHSIRLPLQTISLKNHNKPSLNFQHKSIYNDYKDATIIKYVATKIMSFILLQKMGYNYKLMANTLF